MGLTISPKGFHGLGSYIYYVVYGGFSGGFRGQKGKDFPVKMCQGQGGKGGRG